MSDFFASLAGRIDGTLSVLRPRLPSLFENGGERLARDDAPALTVESAEHEAAPPAAIHRDPPKIAIAPARAVAAEESRAEPLRLKDAKRGIAQDERVQVSEQRAEPAPRQPRKTAVRDDDRPDAAPSEAPRAVVKPAPQTLRATAVAMEAPLRVDRSAGERHDEDASRPRLASAPPRSVEAVPPKPLVPLQHATPAPPPFALPPSPLLPQSARQADRREQAKAAAPSRETAEPTIHVSIGRIEIRAETDAQTRRKPAGASPVMSLDDYLRSRAK